jgi:hypothetical protein
MERCDPLSEPTVHQLDYDDELIFHLAIPESVKALWLEGISSELVSEDVREVFEWQLNHFKEHKIPATASVLAEEFDLNFEEPLTAIGDLIERLQDRWVSRHVKREMEPIADAYKENPLKVIPALQTALRNITSVVRTGSDTVGTGEFDKVLHKYEDNVLRGQGPSLGFSPIDDHFGGVRGVTFVIGAPKTGKSWYATNQTIENLIRGKCVWQYALELPPEEATQRIYHMTAGVEWWKYIKQALTDIDKKKLREASEFLDSCGTFKVVKPPSGQRSIEDMVKRAQDGGADLVIIDQLQYIEADNGLGLGSAEPRQYWPVLNRARDLSDETPLTIMHQFNRSVMGADSMPEMQQAKGAAAIEEVTTLALGLWANKDMRRSGVLEVGTLASRNMSYRSWEIGMNLSRGCELVCNGEIE